MSWLNKWLQNRFSIGKSWQFGWTGYDASEEKCVQCDVRRKDHGMMLHVFVEAR